MKLITAALAAAALSCAFAARAAIKSTKVDAPTVVLKRGSTTVASFATIEQCRAQKPLTITADGQAKESGSGVYDCIYTERTRIAFGPNPPAPTCTTPKPAVEERPGQCPSGTTGAWTQSLTYAPAAYPDCWKGEWLPVAPPTDACVAPNRPPTISGTPAATGVVGVPYSFTPTASDPDGDALTFVVDNRPPWATFDPKTGKLSGTPGPTHVGVRSELRIRVQDGRGGEATLQFPKLTILAAPANQVTLSWLPSTENTDGTTLTDLAGYRIIYGTSASALSQMIEVPNPLTNSYIVSQLSPATYFFAVRAYASGRAESANSNIASKTIQ